MTGLKLFQVNISDVWESAFGRFSLAVMTGGLGGIIVLVTTQMSLKYAALALMTITGAAGLLAIGQIRRPFLALIAFTLPFHVDTFFMLFPRYHQGGAVGLRISSVDLILALLYFLWLAEMSSGRHTRIKLFPTVTIPALVFIILGSISSLFAVEPTLTGFQIFELLKCFLLYLYVANHVQDEADLGWVLAGLMAAMLFQGSLGLYQGVTQGGRLGLTFLGEQNLSALPADADVVPERAAGTFIHSNAYAMYLGISWPVIAALYFITSHRFLKPIAGVVAMVGLGGIIYSFSRGAWLGSLLAISLLVLFGLKKKSVHPVHVGIGVLGFLIAILVANIVLDGIITNRLRGDSDSDASRITVMKGAVVVITNRPVFGSGLNNYIHTMRVYDPKRIYAHGGQLIIVHNVFLLLAAETGLIGLGAFLWLLAALGRRGLTFIKSREADLLAGLTAGLLVSEVYLIWHNMVDMGLVADTQLLALFWFQAGLLVAVTARPDSDKSEYQDGVPLYR
jgi:O-antigen ligase